MKAIIPHILVVLSCLWASNTSAQAIKANSLTQINSNRSPTDEDTVKLQKSRQHILALLQKQEKQKQAGAKAADRTASVFAERLIALSDYDYYAPDTIQHALGLTDTAILKYSNGRGSEFNYNRMIYELPSGAYDGGYLMPYLAGGLRITSSEPNYVPGVLSDSMREWSSTIPATFGSHLYTFGYSDSSYVTYDANNNILYYNHQTDQGMITVDDIYFNTYDISNNNISSLFIEYALLAYDTVELTIQIFSGGTLVEDSLADYGGGGLFLPSDKWIYSYDGAGNLVHASEYATTSGPWVEQTRFDMTYNADNTIKTDSETVLESGSWVPDITDSFGYTSGANYYTFLRINLYGIANERTITSKHIGPMGFPDTVFYYQYLSLSGGTPLNLNMQTKDVYSYDSYQNPKADYTYHFNITDSATGAGYYNSTPDAYTYYYYEDYMPSAVQNIAPATNNIKIYPNPATTALTITSTDKISQITITNLPGQTLFTCNYNAEQVAVNVADLPAGMYLVKINGSEVRKFVKQ